MKITSYLNIYRYLLLLLAMLALLAVGTSALAAPNRNSQKTFASPEEALQSLVTAVRSNDNKALAFILGSGSKAIISSGDPIADKNGRERFVKLYDEKVVIEGAETGKAVFTVGNEDYPYPIPLVKKDSAWRFDTRAGKEELLNRRIGRNELEVIEILHSYVDAQREYFATDWDGDKNAEFARKIRSAPGKKDGLYWPVKEGEQLSPLGPLAAKAASEGYKKGKKGMTALHGYYFRILTAQGKDAEGGAFDYIVNGKMILGYAMVAWPAQYGASGVMTFIVNQNGVVYQKNLGKNTAKIATNMKLYNPDSSWKKLE